MVLGCFMCRRPLVPCEIPKKTNGPSGIFVKRYKQNNSKFPGGRGMGKSSMKYWQYGETTTTSIMRDNNNTNSKQPVIEFTKEMFQPMTTKCGHIFHRGCLKEYSLQLTNRPAAIGNPVICPICSKGFVFAQCFNVYLDALPDPVKDTSDKYIQMLDLQAENAKVKREIVGLREDIATKNKHLVEIQQQIQGLGQEILTKTEDLGQFKKYTQKVGSIDGLIDRLNDSRENYKGLRTQNSLLHKLILDQLRLYQKSDLKELDPGFLNELRSIQKYEVPAELRDEFDNDELSDELNLELFQTDNCIRSTLITSSHESSVINTTEDPLTTSKHSPENLLNQLTKNDSVELSQKPRIFYDENRNPVKLLNAGVQNSIPKFHKRSNERARITNTGKTFRPFPLSIKQQAEPPMPIFKLNANNKKSKAIKVWNKTLGAKSKKAKNSIQDKNKSNGLYAKFEGSPKAKMIPAQNQYSTNNKNQIHEDEITILLDSLGERHAEHRRHLPQQQLQIHNDDEDFSDDAYEYVN